MLNKTKITPVVCVTVICLGMNCMAESFKIYGQAKDIRRPNVTIGPGGSIIIANENSEVIEAVALDKNSKYVTNIKMEYSDIKLSIEGKYNELVTQKEKPRKPSLIKSAIPSYKKNLFLTTTTDRFIQEMDYIELALINNNIVEAEKGWNIAGQYLPKTKSHTYRYLSQKAKVIKHALTNGLSLTNPFIKDTNSMIDGVNNISDSEKVELLLDVSRALKTKNQYSREIQSGETLLDVIVFNIDSAITLLESEGKTESSIYWQLHQEKFDAQERANKYSMCMDTIEHWMNPFHNNFKDKKLSKSQRIRLTVSLTTYGRCLFKDSEYGSTGREASYIKEIKSKRLENDFYDRWAKYNTWLTSFSYLYPSDSQVKESKNLYGKLTLSQDIVEG